MCPDAVAVCPCEMDVLLLASRDPSKVMPGTEGNSIVVWILGQVMYILSEMI